MQVQEQLKLEYINPNLSHYHDTMSIEEKEIR